jgi:DNA-binding MarR family transcriptional regulator
VTSGDRTPPTASPEPAEPAAHGRQYAELHARLSVAPIMRLVGLAGQAVGHRFRRTFAEEDGLSPGAAAVLVTLSFGEGAGLEQGTPGRATHTELAQRCLITPATLTGIVSTLEKAGYVTRERDESDRRVVWLRLTETGAVRARQIGARIRDANTEVMHHLSPELESAMRGFLIAVIENDLVLFQEATPLSPSESGPRAAPSPLDPHSASGRPRC